MRGLLLKEWYMFRKYAAVYILLALVFPIISMMSGNQNFFLLFYPPLMLGLLPVSFLSLDEKSRWILYVKTCPFSDRDIVKSKYLTGLIGVSLMLAGTLLIQFIGRAMQGGCPSAEELMSIITCYLWVGLVPGMILLPITLRLGVEKGRIYYFAVILLICVAGGVGMSVGKMEKITGITPISVLFSILILFLLDYLSYLVAAKLFENREL